VTRVLFDTNILLDAALAREPFFALATAAMEAAGDGRVDGFVAGHAITTVAYLLQRELGTARTRHALTNFLGRLHVAAVTDEAVRLALSAPMSDFEDAVTAMAANEARVDVIVTRDATGFAGSPIPAVLPEAFLASL
jgi:predicted nucleic acid-binding protein